MKHKPRRQKGQHGMTRGLKHAAAGLGVAYGAVTAIPNVALGVTGAACMAIPALAQGAVDEMRTGEEHSISRAFKTQTSWGMAFGSKLLCAKFVTEPSMKHFGHGSKDSNGEERKCGKKENILCPWRAPDKVYKKAWAEDRKKWQHESA
jgi:hypothetical protein